MGVQSATQSGRIGSTQRQSSNRYSEFVDRVNAQRFKMMVGSGNFGRVDYPKLGVPFSMDRPEAVSAHRKLEHELKPAARRRRIGLLRRISALNAFPARLNASEMFITFAGVCSVLCAYAIQRSIK